MWFFLLIPLLGLVPWLSKLWNRLDNKTKELIIEIAVQAFEEILRGFYKWWKSRGSR
jgi:hypothetical protein